MRVLLPKHFYMTRLLAAIGAAVVAFICLTLGAFVVGYIIETIDRINRGGR